MGLIIVLLWSELHLPVGQVKTEFSSPIAKSTGSGLLDTAFFARWKGRYLFFFHIELSKILFSSCIHILFSSLVKQRLFIENE